MHRSHRLFSAAAAVLALAVAGCGGSQGTVPPAGGSSLQSVAQRPSTQSATVSQSFSVSTLDAHRHHGDDFHIVSLLRLDVSNGNASWSEHGKSDCSHGDGDSHKDWDKGYIYTPKADQSLAVPAFSLGNPCNDNDGHHHDRDHDRGNSDTFYVVMVTIPNFSATDVAGPGQRSGGDIVFPAANTLTLNAGQSYAFALVRRGDASPTPSPTPTSASTPTPSPTPTRSAAPA